MEDTQTTNEWKRCLGPLTMEEMQNQTQTLPKTYSKHYLKINIRSQLGRIEVGTSVQSWWECKLGLTLLILKLINVYTQRLTLYRIVQLSLEKLKVELEFGPGIQPLGLHSSVQKWRLKELWIHHTLSRMMANNENTATNCPPWVT